MSPIIRFVILSIAFLSASTLLIAGADKQFRAEAAGSYPHQTTNQITVGAKSFDKPELTEDAFGKKADLLKYGVLPVLVVIENKGRNTLDLQYLEVNLVASDGRHASAVPPQELFHVGRPTKRPGISPVPIPIPTSRKKSPLEAPEIAARAFIAKMLPPNDSASGFFYFEAKPEVGDKLYLNGIRDARSGQELLYFEFPLDR
ncbi:MAG: hypothetical protein ACJ73N_12095 [Bryobacteraceae bacterium]